MMSNYAVTTFSIFLIKIRFVNCHLKNMGELSNKTKFADVENRIAGGEKAELKYFPHNVQFLNMGGMCAGTILNFKTVLTAAHCFDISDNLADMRVFSNSEKSDESFEEKADIKTVVVCTLLEYSRYVFDHKAKKHEVWDFVTHEDYYFGRFANDIAIIIIHDTFQYGSNVQKAYLCTTKLWMNEKETSFYATGWGETKYKDKVSQQGLLKTSLRFISTKKCARMGQFKIHRGTFCLFGDGKRDTCRGDSGGAILWKGMVVGIVSHGSGCANHLPSMYTNVPLYLSWIQKTVLKLHRKFCHSHRNMKTASP